MTSQETPVDMNQQEPDHETQPIDGYVLRVWIGLNTLDAILTWIAFAMGAAEGNALLSSLAAFKGPERMLIAKVFLAILVGSIIWRKQKWHLWPWLNWGMVGVVVWNMLIIGYAL
jgi:hypothetical protein